MIAIVVLTKINERFRSSETVERVILDEKNCQFLYSADEKQFKQINRNTINSIIKPRVEETLELVWQKLKQYDLHKKRIKN